MLLWFGHYAATVSKNKRILWRIVLLQSRQISLRQTVRSTQTVLRNQPHFYLISSVTWRFCSDSAKRKQPQKHRMLKSQSTSFTSSTLLAKCASEVNEVVFVCVRLLATEVVLFGKWGENEVWRNGMSPKGTHKIAGGEAYSPNPRKNPKEIFAPHRGATASVCVPPFRTKSIYTSFRLEIGIGDFREFW